MKPYTTDRSLSAIILLCVFVILTLIYGFSILCPSRLTVYNDGAIFQYIGWRIANGANLYSDVWDHKGPVIFAINALGYLFPTKGSIGIDTIIYLMACVSAFAFYKAFRTRMPASYAASAVMIMVLFELDILAQPSLNTIENTALLFVSLGLWLLLGTLRQQRFQRMIPFLLGVVTSLIFWTKGNYIGFGCFLLTYWALSSYSGSKEIKTLWKNIIWSAIGFFSVASCLFLYFAALGNTAEFLDASFFYNANEYHKAEFKQIILGLAHFSAFILVQLSPFIFVAVAWIFKKSKETASFLKWVKSNPLYASMCVWFIIEVAMCCIKGVVFQHYLIMTYPPLLFCAFMALKNILKKTNYSHILLIFLFLLPSIQISTSITQGIRRNNFNKIYKHKDNQVASLLALNPERHPIATYGGLLTTRILVETRTLDPQKYCINKLVSKNKISQARRQEMEMDFLKTIKNPSIKVLVSEQPSQHIFSNNKDIQEELKNWQMTDFQPSGFPTLDLYFYTKR